MKEKYLVLDNIISENYLKMVVNDIFNYNWKYHQNISNESFLNLEHGFIASLNESQKYFILPLILKICDMSGIKISYKEQIDRIVPRIQTMTSLNNEINDVHVDSGKNHYVIIYYPHDVDGETILYNQTTLDLNFSKFSSMSTDERMELKKTFTILKKIHPKENRALVFNGNRYHASSSPSKVPRCIINVNINYNVDSNKKLLNYQ